MNHVITRHKDSGNAYVSHIGKSKSEALKKKMKLLKGKIKDTNPSGLDRRIKGDSY